MEENNSKQIFVIMCGLSGSGKSHVAKDYADTYGGVVVSSDAIRKELFGDESCQDNPGAVFNEFYKRIREYLKSGCSVIADATNLTIKERKSVLNNARGISCKKVVHIVAKSIERCVLDNEKRDRIVPNEVIFKQACRFQIPFYEEGFDEIVVQPVDNNIRTTPLSELIIKMNTFNQKTHIMMRL